MIYDYEIRKENGKDTLYLFLNFDEEFSKIKSSSKKKSLKRSIKDFIKENKIDFKGTKVALIAGGLLIGTLVLKKPVMEYGNPGVVPAITSNLVISADFESPQNIENSVIKTESVQEIAKVEVKEAPPVKSAKPATSVDKKEPVKVEVTLPKVEVKVPPQKIEEAPKTFVQIKRSSGLVESIELEEYLIGVVGAEMPASFNIEALKSQAVIARTYAMKALERGTVLTDNSSTQNYKDKIALKKTWGNNYNTYYQKIKSAVDATKGKYLTYKGSIIDAVYHSTSNGKTEDAQAVWGNSLPYLVSVSSPYDVTNKSFVKSEFYSYSDASAKLGVPITFESTIEILGKTSGDRVENVRIDSTIISGVKFRNLLGLRSADFTIDIEEEGINITTKGYGHGVGLSQYGAAGMANAGYNYTQILLHYYPNTVLVTK